MVNDLQENKGKDNVAAYFFHQGTNYCAYEYLGCHEYKTDSGYEYVFRVWAPNAQSIALVSDFTSWEYGMAMERITDRGIW